jgi:hypothetical protein
VTRYAGVVVSDTLMHAPGLMEAIGRMVPPGKARIVTEITSRQRGFWQQIISLAIDANQAYRNVQAMARRSIFMPPTEYRSTIIVDYAKLNIGAMNVPGLLFMDAPGPKITAQAMKVMREGCTLIVFAVSEVE